MNTTMKNILNNCGKAAKVTLILLLICGLLYPLLLTGLSQLLFPHQANGSVLLVQGQAVGSALVGQDFTDPRYMKCRPSAVGYNTYTQEDLDSGDYSGVGSGSQNYGATNPALAQRVEEDIATFLEANPGVTREQIPTDLMTASGSGLDPHISPASAAIQLPQLSQNSGLPLEVLQEIVAQHTTGKLLGILGEETVNVLQVNLDIAQKLGETGAAPNLS